MLGGAGCMKQEIESREMAEMAVIVLLNGTKSKIAVRDDDGHLKVENHSILTQYLNPYHNRKKMTKNLADTLSLAFQYYLFYGDDKQIDVCARAILFIYAISSVDLTYWHYDIANGKEKTKQEAILSLVDALFHAFQGKEKVSRTELQNLVYTTAISRHWRIDTEPMEISNACYLSILNAYQLYDMGMYQLNGNNEEKTFRKYGNYYMLPANMTSETFHAELHNRADKVIDEISGFLRFISDLLETDSLNAFKQKHPRLTYQMLHKPINENNRKWKEQVLTCNLGFFDFQNHINDLFQILSFTNLYLLYNALLSYFDEKLLEFQIKYTSEKSTANSELMECGTFKRIIIKVRDSIRYIQLQARVNIEIGTFGSCHCKKNSVRTNRITDMRELIRVMVEYLFYGVSTKIVKEDDNCFSSQKLKEIRSDIVYKYLNGEQKKFTNHVRNALYYRIRYYLYPNERLDGKEMTILPQQFGELLWQFFYYAFGIDFYMLRMDSSDDRTRKEYWCELMRMIFKKIMCNETIYELDRMVNKKFVEFQFKMEGKFISHFTPDEIEFFRHQETQGLANYDMIHEKAMMGEVSYDALSLAEDIIRRLIEAKMAAMLDRINKTKDLIFQLLRTSDAKSFKYHQEYRLPIQAYDGNWKYNFYSFLKDGNGNGEPIAIDDTQLDEFMQWISTGVIANRLQNLKIDFSEIKEKLWILINEFFEMEQISYKTLYGESYGKAEEEKEEKLNAINEKFLECDKIQNLNLMLQRMYKYLLYEDWIDANLKLTWL